MSTISRIARRPWVREATRTRMGTVLVALHEGWRFNIVPISTNGNAIFASASTALALTTRLCVRNTRTGYAEARIDGTVLFVRPTDSLGWERVGNFPSVAAACDYADVHYDLKVQQ